MVSVVNPTGNADIDGVLWGWEWRSGGAQNLTFSFPTATTEYINDGYVSINGFAAFNAAQQTAVRGALADIASFTNLTFTETTNADALLRYGDTTGLNYTNDNTVATHSGF